MWFPEQRPRQRPSGRGLCMRWQAGCSHAVTSRCVLLGHLMHFTYRRPNQGHGGLLGT